MNPTQIEISIMTLQDLDSIKDVLENDFDSFWNYSIFKSELNNPNSVYFVAKKCNQIIGFAGILVVIPEADITNIVVKKNFRGFGISNILMNYLINYCKNNEISKINLEVNCSNIIAIKLYQKFGFAQVGCRKKYYHNEDGLLFSKLI